MLTIALESKGVREDSISRDGREAGQDRAGLGQNQGRTGRDVKVSGTDQTPRTTPHCWVHHYPNTMATPPTSQGEGSGKRKTSLTASEKGVRKSRIDVMVGWVYW